MATKEDITARLKAIGEERRKLGEEIKQASSAVALAAPRLTKALTTKTIGSIVTKMGGHAHVDLEMVDGKLVATVKTSGGGTKSTSRSRAANVETWTHGKGKGTDVESAMPSKVIKAIGEDYGADSPERWLDKNVGKATAHNVYAVIDGKRIPVAEFVKTYPAI